MNIHGLEVAAHSRFLPERAEPAELERRSFRAAKQEEVRPLGAPQSDLGEARREGSENHAEVGGRKRVGLNPLHEHSAWRESFAHGAVILHGKECGDSCNPRVGRLGDDEVVFLPRSQQEVSCVVEDDVQARIVQDAAVEFFKIRSSADYSGLNLHAINSLDIRITGNRGCGHTAAEPDDENAPRRLVKCASQVPQQKLRAGIASGGIRFAIDAESHIVVGTQNTNRVIYAVSRENEIVGCGDFAQREMALIRVPVEHCRKRQERSVVEERGKSDHQRG